MGQRHNTYRLHRPALPAHRVGRPCRNGAAAQRYGDVEHLPVGADGALCHLLCHPQLAQRMGVHHIAVRYQLRLGGGEGIGAVTGEICGDGGGGGGAGAAAHGVLHLLILAGEPGGHRLLHHIGVLSAAQRHHVGKLRHLPRLQSEVSVVRHRAAAHGGGALQHLIGRACRDIQCSVGAQHTEAVIQRAGEVAVQRLAAAGQLLGHRQGVAGQRGHIEAQIAVGHAAAPLQIEEFQGMLGVITEGTAVEGAAYPGCGEFRRQRCVRILLARRADDILPGMAHRAGGEVDGAAVGGVGAADIQHQHVVDVHENVVVAQKLEHHILAADLSAGGHIEVKFHGHAEPQIHRAVRQPVGGQGVALGQLLRALHRVEGEEVAVKRLGVVLLRRFAVGGHIRGVVGAQQIIPQLEPSVGGVVAGGILQGVVVEIPLAVPLEQAGAAAAPHGVDVLTGHRHARIKEVLQAAAAVLRRGAADAQHLGPAVFQRGGHHRPVVAFLQRAVLGILPGAVAERQYPPAVPVQRAVVVEQVHGHVVLYAPWRGTPQPHQRVSTYGVGAVLLHGVSVSGGIHSPCRQQCGAQRQHQQAAQQPPCDPFVFVHAPSSCLCQCGKVFAFRGGL